jgi:hypothetical protein
LGKETFKLLEDEENLMMSALGQGCPTLGHPRAARDQGRESNAML